LLDPTKHITDDIFFFQEDSTVQLLQHSQFPFS